MIIGLAELEEELKRLGSINLYQPMLKATEFVRSAARGLAPVAPYGSGGELRDSVHVDVVEKGPYEIQGICYTDKEYAEYVELGTGPIGAAEHSGISPDVNPSYTLHPWWIHESQIDEQTANAYHFYYIDTEDGRFYMSAGQPAQPFMYPALHDNEDVVFDIIREAVVKK